MANVTTTNKAGRSITTQAPEEELSTEGGFLSGAVDHDDDQGEHETEEFEVALEGSETERGAPKAPGNARSEDEGESDPSQDKETRRRNAALRLERKRQKELEQQARDILDGNIPDHLKVKADLPPQPNYKDYLSDSVLWEKYDGEREVALAAYNADLANWQQNALEKRSESVAKQGRMIQEHNQLQQEITQAASRHYDEAERIANQYGLRDYEQAEETFRQHAPKGVDLEIMRFFPEKSPVIMYYLGKNPHEIQRIINLGPQGALIELTRLSERLSLKPKSQTRSRAPSPDEPLINSNPAGGRIENLRKKMEKAASDGNAKLFRELKLQLKQAEARKR